MAKTRIIIEGEGITPFPEQLLLCSYCGIKGVAAWIGLTIQNDNDDAEGQFPWQNRHYKTKEEIGLFPEDALITVRVEHDGEMKSEFTCPVSTFGEFPEEDANED
jgi:hypothetical protein